MLKIIITKKILPYVLIMDEYDDLIKSRQDIDIPEKKEKIEQYTKYIKDNSIINVGVTATFLSIMLTEENIKLEDIYKLKPSKIMLVLGAEIDLK